MSRGCLCGLSDIWASSNAQNFPRCYRRTQHCEIFNLYDYSQFSIFFYFILEGTCNWYVFVFLILARKMSKIAKTLSPSSRRQNGRQKVGRWLLGSYCLYECQHQEGAVGGLVRSMGSVMFANTITSVTLRWTRRFLVWTNGNESGKPVECTRTYTHTRTPTHTHTCIYVRICARNHMGTRTYTKRRTYKHLYTHMEKYTHTYTHVEIHTSTNI